MSEQPEVLWELNPVTSERWKQLLTGCPFIQKQGWVKSQGWFYDSHTDPDSGSLCVCVYTGGKLRETFQVFCSAARDKLFPHFGGSWDGCPWPASVTLRVSILTRDHMTVDLWILTTSFRSFNQLLVVSSQLYCLIPQNFPKMPVPAELQIAWRAVILREKKLEVSGKKVAILRDFMLK